jgi:hypothetical protein
MTYGIQVEITAEEKAQIEQLYRQLDTAFDRIVEHISAKHPRWSKARVRAEAGALIEAHDTICVFGEMEAVASTAADARVRAEADLPQHDQVDEVDEFEVDEEAHRVLDDAGGPAGRSRRQHAALARRAPWSDEETGRRSVPGSLE